MPCGIASTAAAPGLRLKVVELAALLQLLALYRTPGIKCTIVTAPIWSCFFTDGCPKQHVMHLMYILRNADMSCSLMQI